MPINYIFLGNLGIVKEFISHIKLEKLGWVDKNEKIFIKSELMYWWLLELIIYYCQVDKLLLLWNLFDTGADPKGGSLGALALPFWPYFKFY